MICIRQFQDRLRKILLFSTEMFSSHPQATPLSASCNELLNDMKRFETETFNGWKESILSEIEYNEEYNLQTNGRMMELDQKTGIVRVNYSDKLVLLIKEIRQLSDLGYRKQIPESVFKVAAIADKYYK